MNKFVDNSETLLRVFDLKVHFPVRRRMSFARRSFVHAVDGVSFSVPRGSTFGLIGESGCGKTTTVRAILRLIPITSGQVQLGNINISEIAGEELRRVRRSIQIVFQDPSSSLNPRLRAGRIVHEPLDFFGIGEPTEHEEIVAELFASVGLRPEQRFLFPHQFSGGQRQRIGVARALACRPEVIVCDEPVSSLDVAIQAQILNLLCNLQRKFNLTYVFISHDMGVVQHMCDEIAVMYLGTTVEQAGRIELFRNPLHPYTLALLSSVPSLDPGGKEPRGRVRLSGEPRSPIDPSPGCRFLPRCSFAKDICNFEMPDLKEVEMGHLVACHLMH